VWWRILIFVVICIYNSFHSEWRRKEKFFSLQKYDKKNEQQIAVKSNHAQVGEGERKTKERRGNIIIAINIVTDEKSGKGYKFDDVEC
jgi:hypothetical protein